MKKLILATLLVLITLSCSSQKEKSTAERRATLYYTQGTQNLIDQDYTQALKNLLEAKKYRPNDTKVLNNLGMAYYFKKSINNAKTYLKQALQIDDKNSEARMNLANILMEEKKYNQAETQFKRILEDLVFNQQYKTYHNLSKLEMKKNNQVAAVDYLKKSIEANENYCPGFYDLGKIQFNQGKYIQAERNFREASMGLCYKSPEPRFFRAKSLVKLNQLFEASQILEEMTETFAMTKWEAIARKGINRIKKVHDRKVLDTLEAKSTNQAISSPDF